MKYTVEDIYRVVYRERGVNEPETEWTCDRKECEDYIEKSYYKHTLFIEEAKLAHPILSLKNKN